MKKLAYFVAVTTAATMMSQAAQADEVKGSAKADFDADELIVPCVEIEGYSDAADGTFFDLIFDRRGNSFNYELKFGEPEDAAVCEELANYAIFIDEDADDDEEGEDEATDVFASCEVRVDGEEQTRSKIKVKAKDMEAGDYYVIVNSSDNTLQSETQTIEEDEAEFNFSSNEDDVSEGAEAIEADFIIGESVLAEVFDAATDEVVLSETVSCRVKD